MLPGTLTLFKKDIHLLLGSGSSLIQAVLLGLLLIFLFSLSAEIGAPPSAQAAAALFWMATIFSQVLIFNTLFSYEESHGQRSGLLLGTSPIQAIWLGKTVTAFIALLVAQLIFIIAVTVFLGHSFQHHLVAAIAALLLCDIGSLGLGALLGAIAQGRDAKESLLSLILFPLLLPLFLIGIAIFSSSYTGLRTEEIPKWLRLAGAFDAIFLSAAFFLFPFVYDGEE